MKIYKLTAIIMAFIMVLSLTACGKPKPEESVEAFIQAYKEKRFDDMTGMLVQGENYVRDIYIKDNADSEVLFDNLTQNLYYNIKNVNVADNRATVTVEMTNYDTSIVMNEFLEKYFQNSLAADKGNGEAPDVDSLFSSTLKETFENAGEKKVTNTVDIKLIYAEDKWLISDDWAVFDGLTGGYVSFVSQTTNSLNTVLSAGSSDGSELNTEITTTMATTTATNTKK